MDGTYRGPLGPGRRLTLDEQARSRIRRTRAELTMVRGRVVFRR